jgi:UDPglucose 6-dehydrogenase
MKVKVQSKQGRLMTKATIGFVGMTHLGLVSGVAASQKGFKTICFDVDKAKINNLLSGKLPVSEPQLEELINSNSAHLFFTANPNELAKCNVVYVAQDVGTDDHGQSDLDVLNGLLDIVFKASNLEATIVILSQVPPGYMRGKWDGRRSLYYQVETLIFGRAIERALFPERYIIGCAQPKTPLPKDYQNFLDAPECPILPMRYESAELAKISINMFLVASVTTTNTIAELCEKIGADWSEISPALRLDRRIGSHAYLSPGLGISGGNLERDLATVCNYAKEHNCDARMVQAWIANSQHRKSWPVEQLEKVIDLQNASNVIGILGLAYKEDTHSTKNSPAIKAISKLQAVTIKVYDPKVVWQNDWHHNAIVTSNSREILPGINALMILTPWAEFKDREFLSLLAGQLRNIPIIDPYGLVPSDLIEVNELQVYSLGRFSNFEDSKKNG